MVGWIMIRWYLQMFIFLNFTEAYKPLFDINQYVITVIIRLAYMKTFHMSLKVIGYVMLLTYMEHRFNIHPV